MSAFRSGTRPVHPDPCSLWATLLTSWLLLPMGMASAQGLELLIPIACEIGGSCEIQNYVDRDSGSGIQDYSCGTTTYDQHNGTDFRVPTLAAQRAGVAVLASASGRVLRARDGVEDASVREKGRDSVDGAECGNGVVIDHGGGWETQYCHMAKGTLKALPGDQVKAGEPIGSVGLSGLTEYPHLHFTVRLNGKVVDPFAADATTCGAGHSLWSASAQASLTYRTRVVLNKGFAAGPVTNEMIEASHPDRYAPNRQSSALVAYVRVINARQGDVQKLILHGHDGATLAENTLAPTDRDKAQIMMFVGSKIPVGGWPAGQYEATYTIMNGDRVVAQQQFRLNMN